MKKLTILMALAIAVAVAVGLLSGPAGFGPGTAVGASTFTVNTTGDASDASAGDGTCETATVGECTLRAAIEEANALAGADTIAFNIPGAGPHTISPASALPTITDPVIIDGTTEPDFAGSPVIELEGSGAGVDANGLKITAGSSTVRGLVINRFAGFVAGGFVNGHGIWLRTGGGNTIEGNYIGTDVTGTVDLGNGKVGVYILESASNTIGGTTAEARNVISGNDVYGMYLVGNGATGNTIEGNYIGTDVTGTADLGNTRTGIVLVSAPSNSIGGTASEAGNVISGNGPSATTRARGIWIRFSESIGNTIEGNYIGTDVTGTTALGNEGDGIEIVGASGNSVGGTAAGAGNVISGNGNDGVLIQASFGNTIQGNYIGTDVTGAVDLGNTRAGVLIKFQAGSTPGNLIGGTTSGAGNVISGNDASGVKMIETAGDIVEGNFIGTDVSGVANLGNSFAGLLLGNTTNIAIGGAAAGAANTIAYNGDAGVRVVSNSIGNRISRNSIHSNIELGIELGTGDGVTPNDIADVDSGPNNLQNFPVLTSAVSGSTNIEGTLNSTANTEFRVEFFANTACDLSGNGEGETFLGFDTVTTGGTGDVIFSVSFPTTGAVGQFITATATDPAGNTSEFSACIEAPPPPDEQININVVGRLSGAKLEGSCWRISYGPAKVANDVVGDDVAGVKPDCGEPSNVKLFDKDPSAGNLRITITSAQRVQFGDIWHVQMSFEPKGRLDTFNYVCDLSLGKCEIGPVAVGGLVVDLDEGPLAAAQPSGGGAGRLAGTVAGVAALAVALTGAAWYARRLL